MYFLFFSLLLISYHTWTKHISWHPICYWRLFLVITKGLTKTVGLKPLFSIACHFMLYSRCITLLVWWQINTFPVTNSYYIYFLLLLYLVLTVQQCTKLAYVSPYYKFYKAVSILWSIIMYSWLIFYYQRPQSAIEDWNWQAIQHALSVTLRQQELELFVIILPHCGICFLLRLEEEHLLRHLD